MDLTKLSPEVVSVAKTAVDKVRPHHMAVLMMLSMYHNYISEETDLVRGFFIDPAPLVASARAEFTNLKEVDAAVYDLNMMFLTQSTGSVRSTRITEAGRVVVEMLYNEEIGIQATDILYMGAGFNAHS